MYAARHVHFLKVDQEKNFWRKAIVVIPAGCIHKLSIMQGIGSIGSQFCSVGNDFLYSQDIHCMSFQIFLLV